MAPRFPRSSGGQSLRVTFTSNADAVARAQERFGAIGARAARKIVTKKAKEMVEELRRTAPIGPPKRRTPVEYLDGSSQAPYEGMYRDSIQRTTTRSGGVTQAEVYTDSPYAFRLEYGFSGFSDILGRDYQYWETTPKPHWKPVADRIEAELGPEIEIALAEATRYWTVIE
jgi:hypothetical protein